MSIATSYTCLVFMEHLQDKEDELKHFQGRNIENSNFDSSFFTFMLSKICLLTLYICCYESPSVHFNTADLSA